MSGGYLFSCGSLLSIKLHSHVLVPDAQCSFQLGSTGSDFVSTVLILVLCQAGGHVGVDWAVVYRAVSHQTKWVLPILRQAWTFWLAQLFSCFMCNSWLIWKWMKKWFAPPLTAVFINAKNLPVDMHLICLSAKHSNYKFTNSHTEKSMNVHSPKYMKTLTKLIINKYILLFITLYGLSV